MIFLNIIKIYYFLSVYKTHSLHASLLAGTAFAAVRRESRKQGDTTNTGLTWN